jgi:hypothetical protein
MMTPAGLAAGEPAIRNLDVRGLQIGGTTTLVVDGDGLGTAPRLLLPFTATQKLKPGATATRATFEVTLNAGVQPGYYNLWLAANGGVSLPVVIGVDRLPQRALAAKVDALPAALHGAVSGSTVVSTKFTGKAKQQVRIEVEARRLGSGLRPVVHLYDAKRKQIAWAWGKPALRGDARLEAALPADGTYTLSVHDTEYASPFPGFFRLKIGQWSGADQVFPPVVGKDTKTVELLGPAAPVRVDVPAARSTRVLPLAWPAKGTWSGPRPFVLTSPHAEVVAKGDGKVQDLPAGAVGVSGRLLKPDAEDRFRVPVKPGSKVRLEVFAERLGSPLDVTLVVRNEKGGELARVEDGPGSLDPVLDFTVPALVKSIVVAVQDADGRGGARGVYRLTVSDAQASAGKPDFRLVTPIQRITLPVGGRMVIPVFIQRRGYRGSVELSAKGLPAGMKLEGTRIPAGADGALVTVHRGSAKGDPVITTWRGRAEDGTERSIQVQGHSMQQLQPWLATELALALTRARASDFQVDWRALPASAGLLEGRKLVLPVKLTRPATNTLVRLRLRTSQLPPLINGQPNLGLMLREERPVELPMKIVEGALTVIVPADLPGDAYDVAVRADLLALDRRTVLATAFTPVRRLAVRPQLVVRLAGAARIEAQLNARAATTVEIKGKVERREGLAGDVLLTLTGLPPGVGVAPVTVKAGATDFALKVALPPNLPAGEVKGLQLAGSAVPDPKQPAIRIRSKAVALTLAVKAAPK